MNHATNPMPLHNRELNFLEKTAAIVSWLVAAAVFLKIGWLAMEPDDPLGSVSLLSRSGATWMLIEAAALSAVTAGIATVLVGWRLPDAGALAASIGLALVSFKGRTASLLLLDAAEGSSHAQSELAVKFAVEAIGWVVVVFAACVASALVMRWVFGTSDSHARSGSVTEGPAPLLVAILDAPRLGAWFSDPDMPRTPVAAGLRHSAVALGAAIAAMAVLSAGLSTRSIQHGQACFVVAAGVCIASVIAQRLAPVRSSLWTLLAVAVLPLPVYLWAAVQGSDPTGHPAVPASHFLRILPIQYISVGMASAIIMFWYVGTVAQAPEDRAEPTARTGRAKGAR